MKKDLLDFKINGTIYLNTLCNLRSEKEPIRDELEGIRRLAVSTGNEISSCTEEASKKGQFILLLPNVYMQVADAFVFCTSLKLDDRLGKKWGYDSYYKITDPMQFAETVYWNLNKYVSLRGFMIGKVKYRSKDGFIETKDKNRVLQNYPINYWDFCFTKPEKFSYEKEFRMVFVLEHTKEIKPLLLTCLELEKSCKC